MDADRRHCAAMARSGGPCRAWAVSDDEYCFQHSPKHAAEAAEASRAGGLRRRKEAVLAEVYDFPGFVSAEDVMRFLSIAASDLLGLENTVKRAHAIAYVSDVALRALKAVEFDRRLAAIERALKMRGDAE